MVGAENGAGISVRGSATSQEGERVATWMDILVGEDDATLSFGRNGSELITLETGQGAPLLRMSNGQHRVKLGGDFGLEPNDGSMGLYLEDSMTRTRACLEVTKDSQPRFAKFDENGMEIR